METNELMHYGVKGMRWGVHRFQNRDGRLTTRGINRAEKDAKKIANMKARENDRIAYLERRQKTSSNPRSINKASMKILDTQAKTKAFVDKVIAKYANTSISDITIDERVYKGKKYIGVLMGRVGNSPYDGTPRYEVTAGTWTKSNNFTKSTNSNPKRISRKTYNKFQADDVEGVVRNMSKTQYDDVRKHVGNSMDNGDWDKVEDYIARKYS